MEFVGHQFCLTSGMQVSDADNSDEEDSDGIFEKIANYWELTERLRDDKNYIYTEAFVLEEYFLMFKMKL